MHIIKIICLFFIFCKPKYEVFIIESRDFVDEDAGEDGVEVVDGAKEAIFFL